MTMSFDFFVPISELDAATLNTQNGGCIEGLMHHDVRIERIEHHPKRIEFRVNHNRLGYLGSVTLESLDTDRTEIVIAHTKRTKDRAADKERRDEFESMWRSMEFLLRQKFVEVDLAPDKKKILRKLRAEQKKGRVNLRDFAKDNRVSRTTLWRWRQESGET